MAEDGVRIEQLGFESVWLPDHFYYQEEWGLDTHPEVWTLLTAIAVKTERVRLGTNVLAATFRHPALMAKMSGAVQELSGGRFVLGLGAGNQAHEHAAFGLDFEHRIGRMKEYLPIVSAFLNGESVTLLPSSAAVPPTGSAVKLMLGLGGGIAVEPALASPRK